MKHNCKFVISYDGTRYYGWEHQPTTDLTIQGKLEKVLERLEGHPVDVIGAGRTDAGVHARAMVANAFLENELSEEELLEYMNRYLPEDICVTKVTFAGERFHARYNAKGKTYRYTVAFGPVKPVFDRKYVYYVKEKPDIKAMEAAALILKGEHDFAGFCANPRMKKSTVRTVDMIDIHEKGDRIYFTFHGKGFLQNMVRILTGTLLEVGYGKRTPESMAELLEKKDRKLSGETAPAAGLTLIEVDYS